MTGPLERWERLSAEEMELIGRKKPKKGNELGGKKGNKWINPD